MSLIVKTISRLVGGMVILFGLYIILHGHLSPGGGFAGGVIIAAGLILLTLAFGKEISLKILSQSAASVLESVGGLIFLSTALLGLAGGYFFLNLLPKGHAFRLFSGGIIPICNIAIGLTVGTALFAVFMAISILRINGSKK